MRARFKVFRFAALAMLLAVASTTAHAANPAACTVTLIGCYDRAAQYPTFLLRAAAGIDCDINFAACVRAALLYRQ
jgi:hypothetical protein